ncbi:DUF2510 domain-containing protein, partial [Actinospica sp.]|uniref:DUF2510 domain-containing protein n=1 Tax=Actinospica sp. TaxID=1872142 RepID=UPI002C812A64
MSTGNPPAGYYADPSIPGYIRYWDGAEWVAGTSRPAPEEAAQDAAQQVAGQQPGSSRTDAAAGRSSSGTWQPEPAATSQAGQPDPPGRSAGRSQSGARGYAQSPATTAGPSPAPAQVPQQSPQQGRHSRTGDKLPQQYADSAQQHAEPARQQQAPPQPQQQPAVQWPATAAPSAPAQPPRQAPPQPVQPQPPQPPPPQPQPVQPQPVQPQPVRQAVQPQPQQYAQRPVPVPAVQPQPQPAAQQVPESVATMIVPSAFAPSQRTGTYRLPGNINNPFAGLPGSPDFGSAVGQDEEEPGGETTVVELATPGSRFLGRIIDIGIAAIFSAPITVTLLLIAHRHDHQYVLKLDSQAT